MSDYVTDPDLLAKLNAGGNATSTETNEYVTDPDLLEKLNKGYETDPAILAKLNTETRGPVSPGQVVLGAVAPTVTGAAYGVGTGAGPAGRIVGGAVMPFAKEVLGSYVSKPLTAVADAVLASTGIPPLVGPASGLADRAAAVRQGMVEASKQASMGAPTLSPVKGVPTTTTVGPYFEMLKSVPRDVADKISNIWNTQGGNNAVRAWLNSAEGQALQRVNPEFAAKAANFTQAAPGMLTQAGRVLRPLAVGAARIAGPAGMAYNIYEAAPYLEQANIGQRTQSGEVGQMMRDARRAMLNAPTPAPLSPQEAGNLLASGDERTINIYGGRARLQEIINGAIRQKAASKVLGPVAPGQ